MSIALNPSSTHPLPMHHLPRTSSVASSTAAGAANTGADTVTLSAAGLNRYTQALSQTADFSSMKPSEVLGAMNELIKSGRMSLDESSALLALVPTPLKPGVAGAGNDLSDDPMNVFQRLQEMIDSSMARHDDAVARHVQKALTALERIAGAGQG